MPLFLSLGVSKAEFEDSTPKDLSCYVDAESMRRKRRDVEAWEQGMYNFSAFSTALARALSGFSGKKSRAEYMKEPMSEAVERAAKEKENDLTEAEKETERSKLLMALMTMQANFELNHGREDE